MGKFVGDVVSKWLVQGGDDRNMELLEPFGFIADDGTAWEVPAGAIVDGASIPRILWIFGSPFVGDYRRASVIHDHFCKVKTRDWRSTHRVFYYGCISDGVWELKAKVMFAAVYSAARRWSLATSDLIVLFQKGTVTIPEGSEIDVIANIGPFEYDSIVDWINENNPNLDEIENRADQYIYQVPLMR